MKVGYVIINLDKKKPKYYSGDYSYEEKFWWLKTPNNAKVFDTENDALAHVETNQDSEGYALDNLEIKEVFEEVGFIEIKKIYHRS